MNDNEDFEVVDLYDGDMRLDNLLLDIETAIYNTCGGRGIAIMSLIGVLERVKWRFMQELDEE